MTIDPYSVDLVECRNRQQRLLHEMESLDLELAILTRNESVQWLTGAYTGSLFSPAATLDRSGKVTLVLPSRKVSLLAAADEIVPYEEKWHSTLRDEQRTASDEVLLSTLSKNLTSVGGEWSFLSPRLQAKFANEVANIEPLIFQLRRRKSPDEIRMMKRANDANRRMYQEARKIVEPGINELEVYSSLQSVAVEELGEALTYFGQDFRCNARGGLPRNREAQAGELYILDLGVGFRGFYSDNARTLSVGGDPTQKQLEAWKHLMEVFPLIEEQVRPGVSCRAIFEEVQALLDKCSPWVFNHHLGHGVGLAPHEGPHLNPHWNDTFEEGDFFTAEPGLYHEELRHGIRLEQNYLVTSDGVECLTDYPLEL